MTTFICKQCSKPFAAKPLQIFCTAACGDMYYTAWGVRYAGGDSMDPTLGLFREIADQMIGRADWEWVGPHLSQRMFGITRERAEGYAKAHGGTARQMTQEG
jgi:hypothetical protein